MKHVFWPLENFCWFLLLRFYNKLHIRLIWIWLIRNEKSSIFSHGNLGMKSKLRLIFYFYANVKNFRNVNFSVIDLLFHCGPLKPTLHILRTCYKFKETGENIGKLNIREKIRNFEHLFSITPGQGNFFVTLFLNTIKLWISVFLNECLIRITLSRMFICIKADSVF